MSHYPQRENAQKDGRSSPGVIQGKHILTMDELVGSNFETWARRTKQELQDQGVWELVDSKQRTSAKSSDTSAIMKDKQRLERANRIIVDSLEPHILRDVMMSAPPWNLWKVIEDKYAAEPVGSIMDRAFDAFDSHVTDEKTSLAKLLSAFADTMEALYKMSFPVPDHIQTMLLLHSLRSSRFLPVVQEVRRMQKVPSMANVMELLRQYDRHLQSQCSVQADSAASDFSEQAIYAFARAVSSRSQSPESHASYDHTAYSTWSGSVEDVKPIAPLQQAPCSCSCQRHQS